MSAQFGRWSFEGQQLAWGYLNGVNAVLAPYGPDSNEVYSEQGVEILYRAFRTTKEAHGETQPHVSLSGAVITWDGRLDNRGELISELRDSLSPNATDVEIVAAAYEKLGTDSFGKLVGDWAVSIWNRNSRSLILAKDPIGTRHLYYSFDENQVTWSTILDPLVLFAGKTFRICEEYIAGWISCLPAAHLTPYVDIHSVPPSSAVLLGPGKHTVRKYWDFDPDKKVRYRTDAEYEDAFRTIFAMAVQRRLRSDCPILAELSGGIDSSSIVCMADLVIASGAVGTPRLDTVSWDVYSEPDSLEDHAYFTKVEEKRGCTGYHIDLASGKDGDAAMSPSAFESDLFAATPTPSFRHSEPFKQLATHMREHGYRITLSGIGGESATGGGVPTPRPELQNLLARARFLTLAHQLRAWAFKMKKRESALLWEAAQGFCRPLSALEVSSDILTTSWFHTGFIHRNRAALSGYPHRVKVFGPLPSFQGHLGELDCERRLMAFYAQSPDLLHEVRYPYLDRSLLEFMYAIPQDQIVRVGQRRSLMKRSLVGVVPNEILHRRRKATAEREWLTDSPTALARLLQGNEHIMSDAIGIVDSYRLMEALHEARRNKAVSIERLKRTLLCESWLRHLTSRGVLTKTMSTSRSSLVKKECPVPTQSNSSAS